jgi:hypothetical protein
MSMRNYAALLVLENVYDYVPTSNQDLVNFANSIFTPNVQVVTPDCGTTLGSIQTVNFDLEGEVELATDQVISFDRIVQLLSAGTYTIATRTLDTCIAPGGVCQLCYAASRQNNPFPAVQSRVVIEPEYTITTTVVPTADNTTVYTLDLSVGQYTNAYVYLNGILQPSSAYTITTDQITFNTAPPEGINVVVRFTAYNKSPFVSWLANTYAGSMFGMKALPSQPLMLRSLLLESLISDAILNILIEYTSQITLIPANFVTYMSQIKNKLEKALYMIALNCVFTIN